MPLLLPPLASRLRILRRFIFTYLLPLQWSQVGIHIHYTMIMKIYLTNQGQAHIEQLHSICSQPSFPAPPVPAITGRPAGGLQKALPARRGGCDRPLTMHMGAPLL